MELSLNDDEVRTLRSLLEAVLPEIKMELARTSLPARELRHELVQRQELCERILSQLPSAAT